MNYDIMERATNIINMVFGDTSVSQQETIERLLALKEQIEMNIQAIRDDLRYQEEEEEN